MRVSIYGVGRGGWARYSGAMMTRLQFLRSLVQVSLAAVAVPVLVPALGACKKDDDSPTPDAGGTMKNPDASMGGPIDAGADASTPPPTCGTATAMIGSNHGHAIAVSAADVNAGIEKMYPIQGSSQHPHTVTLTAADFATLRETGTLMVMSSMDANHRHAVTVTCA
jgi:hypothetical protein